MSSTTPPSEEIENQAILLRLYLEKWNAMPDIPTEEAVPDKYFKELPGSASTTPAMDAYFRKLIFLFQTPDGTPLITTPKFLEWVRGRPKLCAAVQEFMPMARAELNAAIQKGTKNGVDITQPGAEAKLKVFPEDNVFADKMFDGFVKQLLECVHKNLKMKMTEEAAKKVQGANRKSQEGQGNGTTVPGKSPIPIKTLKEAYTEELMSMPDIVSMQSMAADLPAFYAFWERVNKLSKLPDGSSTLSGAQFAAWLRARPNIKSGFGTIGLMKDTPQVQANPEMLYWCEKLGL